MKESAKENTSKPSPKKGCFEDKTKRTSQANSDSYKTYLNTKKVHVMKQGAVKKNMLEYVIVREKVILNIQAGNQMETVATRRRINCLCVVGKVTLKI